MFEGVNKQAFGEKRFSALLLFFNIELNKPYDDVGHVFFFLRSDDFEPFMKGLGDIEVKSDLRLFFCFLRDCWFLFLCRLFGFRRFGHFYFLLT